MFNTYHTTPILQGQQVTGQDFNNQVQEVLKQVQYMLDNKGGDYNQLTTFIENMPFGDLSWATLCWIKAHRVASILRKEMQGQQATYDGINDIILDLAVYAIGWLAFRKSRHDTAAIDTKAAWQLMKDRLETEEAKHGS